MTVSIGKLAVMAVAFLIGQRIGVQVIGMAMSRGAQ